MIVSFLAAVDRNLVLGDEKGIPWHLPADLRRFRRLTLGKPIVMGRTTFEHVGKPLDKRVNIVLSRRTDFHPDGVLVARSMEELTKYTSPGICFVAPPTAASDRLETVNLAPAPTLERKRSGTWNSIFMRLRSSRVVMTVAAVM